MGVNSTETHVFSWLTRVKEARTELRPGSHGLKVEEPKHVRDGLSAIKESGRCWGSDSLHDTTLPLGADVLEEQLIRKRMCGIVMMLCGRCTRGV